MQLTDPFLPYNSLGRGEYLGFGEFKFRSLNVSSCHSALRSTAHKVSAAGCFSSSLLGALDVVDGFMW